MKCTNCSFENKDTAKFCIKCGTPLPGQNKTKNIVTKTEKVLVEDEKETSEIYQDTKKVNDIQVQEYENAGVELENGKEDLNSGLINIKNISKPTTKNISDESNGNVELKEKSVSKINYILWLLAIVSLVYGIMSTIATLIWI